MNSFLIIANIINIIYNIPQMIKTYKTKSTRDFSGWFIFLRIVGNTIWVAYAIEIDSLQMLVNNIVTVLASVFIGYYKCNELYCDYKERNQLKNDEPLLLENNIANEDDNGSMQSFIIKDDNGYKVII